MQFSDLPVELWVHVISFLPLREVKRLLTLNSVFLKAGLNARWRVVTIYPSTGVERQMSSDRRFMWLQRLRDPYIARTIKKIDLQVRSTFVETVDKLVPVFEHICSNVKLLDLSFNISELEPLELGMLSPLFATLWGTKSFYSDVKTLAIVANSFGLQSSLIGNRYHPIFPRLRTLSFCFQGVRDWWIKYHRGMPVPVDCPAKVLAVVLGDGGDGTDTKRISAVENLTIRMDDLVSSTEATGILDVLAGTSFLNLSDLILQIDTEYIASSIGQFTRFLSANSATLQGLSISPGVHVETALLNVAQQNPDAFSRLTSLEYRGESTQTAAAVVERCRPRLRSLTCGGSILFEPKDFVKLFDDPLPQLQTLFYVARTFSKDQLIILERSAPALLSLSIYIIGSDKVVKPSLAEIEMCKALEGEVFTKFKLNYLSVREVLVAGGIERRWRLYKRAFRLSEVLVGRCRNELLELIIDT